MLTHSEKERGDQWGRVYTMLSLCHRRSPNMRCKHNMVALPPDSRDHKWQRNVTRRFEYRHINTTLLFPPDTHSILSSSSLPWWTLTLLKKGKQQQQQKKQVDNLNDSDTRSCTTSRTTNASADVSEAAGSDPLSSLPLVPSVLRRPSSSPASSS